MKQLGEVFINPADVSAIEKWIDYGDGYYNEGDTVRGSFVILRNKNEKIRIKGMSPKEVHQILFSESTHKPTAQELQFKALANPAETKND